MKHFLLGGFIINPAAFRVKTKESVIVSINVAKNKSKGAKKREQGADIKTKEMASAMRSQIRSPNLVTIQQSGKSKSTGQKSVSILTSTRNGIIKLSQKIIHIRTENKSI